MPGNVTIDDVRAVVDGTSLLLRSAGVKTYQHYWIEHLQRTAGRNFLSIFPYLRRLRGLNHEGSNQPDVSTRLRLLLVGAANRRFFGSDRLTETIAGKTDLFHISQHLLSFPRRTKITATLFDMTCWTAPETHTPANIAATKAYTERVLRRADAVIAISESARQDAIRIAGFSPQKIERIYPGVADGFFGPTRDSICDAKRAYHLCKPYVLCVGAIEPRKNLDRLLDAWKGLPEDVREHYELVIAGPLMWGVEQTGARLLRGDSGIRYLGYTAEALLPGLTAGAYAFAYPSLYEGFGLPLAQALAAGVPAVTSNVSSLPEVAGDAALLADPRSVEEIRTALEKMLTSPSLRTKMAAAAPLQAERFRWSVAARQSWDLFMRICSC